ncbi:uncharacterized protein LOC139909204 [Centroberyx gerrardi]
MASPHPLIHHPLVSISNGASHMEEEEDEDEQGGKFEFDDSDEMQAPQVDSNALAKSNRTTDTGSTNLNLKHSAKTNTVGAVEEPTRQEINGTPPIRQEVQNTPSLYHHFYCSDMEVRESPEGRSTSSDLGLSGEAESFWKANSIYKGKPPDASQDEASSPANVSSPQQDTDQDVAPGLDRPQTEDPISNPDKPTRRDASTRSPESVARPDQVSSLEVIYDDVPSENLQSPMEDGDDIYEDIQRPGRRGSNNNGWSSSEFESYDELSDSETKPPARSSSKPSPDVQRLKERCALTRRELAVRLGTPDVAHIKQSCDIKVTFFIVCLHVSPHLRLILMPLSGSVN